MYHTKNTYEHTTKVRHSLRRANTSRIGIFVDFWSSSAIVMLMFCSTGRACLGILLVDITSGQRHEFRERSRRSTSSSCTDYRVLWSTSMPAWFQGTVIEWIYVCDYILIEVVVAHLWGRLSVERLSAIAPLKPLDIDKNTQYRQYWESCVGCRYIAVLFPAGKFRGTINRGTTAAVFHTAHHSTTQGHHSNAQPNYGPTGWWQALTRWLPTRYTLRPRRALLWHARRAIVLSILFGRAASRRFCFSR